MESMNKTRTLTKGHLKDIYNGGFNQITFIAWKYAGRNRHRKKNIIHDFIRFDDSSRA